jgi:hypothetical protein
MITDPIFYRLFATSAVSAPAWAAWEVACVWKRPRERKRDLLTVLACRPKHHATVGPFQAQWLTIERKERHLGQVSRHQVIQSLRSAVVRAAIALDGEEQDAATQIRLVPVKLVE